MTPPGAFRLFLALVVLVSHSCRVDFGATAVYVFFVLSGYWIHRMWTLKYSRSDRPLRVFYTSRLWRIFPAFWLVNLLATAVLAAGLTADSAGGYRPPAGWTHAVFSNLFLLGYASLPPGVSALRVAWSLDVELQFYLVLPLLAVLCAHPRWGRGSLVALVLLAIAGMGAFLIPDAEPPRNLGHVALFFLAGAAASRWDWEPDDRLAALSLIATVAIAGSCWLSPTCRLLFENNKHGATEAVEYLRRSAQAGLAFVAIPFALKTVRQPSSPLDRSLGEISFVVYLIHWPVMMVHSHYFEHVPPGQRWPSLAGAWIVIGLLTAALFKGFDQPIERARKRWVAKHQPSP